MKLRSLEMRNYRRHARTVIEWPDGVIAILGRNGSGKSTILEAIGFALFGVPATRTGKELLRWDGAGPMDHVSVALEFELGGQAIRIHRELRGKALTPNATLTVDGKLAVDPGAGSNEAVTTDIEQRLGMDRETFFTTLVAQQKDLDRLAEMTPAKRKQLLLEMLGIDTLDRAIERARLMRRDAQAKVDALRDTLPDAAGLKLELDQVKQVVAEATNNLRIANESWERTKTQHGAAQDALAALRLAEQEYNMATRAHEDAVRARDELLRQQTQINARVADAQAASNQAKGFDEEAAQYTPLQEAWNAAQRDLHAWDAREKALALLDQERARISGPAAQQDLPALTQACETAAAEVHSLTESKARHLAEQAAHAKHLSGLEQIGDAAACPTCQRPLDEHLPQLLERMQRDHAAATAALTHATQQLNDAHQRHVAAQRALDDATSHAHAIARLKEREAAIPAGPAQRPDVVALEAQLARARNAHEERLRLQSLTDALPQLMQEAQGIAADLEAAEAAVVHAAEGVESAPNPGDALVAAIQSEADAATAEREAERHVLSCQAAGDVAAQKLENVQRMLERERELRTRLQAAEEDARYLAAVASGRGKGLLEAFKAHLVARIGPAIGREASRLLERFTRGRYTEVTLDAEYNLYVADGGKRYTIDRFSGGEADLVHLALRLSVSRLLVERNAAEMRFIALDEVFGSLDAERRTSVLVALQELGSLYSQVLLVTHHDSLREALDAALLVEDIDGQSRVSLHAG